jgi:hypothetical protein
MIARVGVPGDQYFKKAGISEWELEIEYHCMNVLLLLKGAYSWLFFYQSADFSS